MPIDDAPKGLDDEGGQSKEGTWPFHLRPMDASLVRYTGPTAILPRFPGRLLDPAFAHVTSFSVALVLGPERGWSR